jgi:hypothetical protein
MRMIPLILAKIAASLLPALKSSHLEATKT